MKLHQVIRAAIYARVSSERQADAATIASQVAALRARVTEDGITLEDDLCFIDDGFTGTTLVRPALERLRDRAALGDFDRVYVHSPDRLARKYAYQVLLIDELQRHGVEFVFLNRPVADTPEDQLLLHVQGVIAEYEAHKAPGAMSSRQAPRGTPRRRPRSRGSSVRLSLRAQGRRRWRCPLRHHPGGGPCRSSGFRVGRARTVDARRSLSPPQGPGHPHANRKGDLGSQHDSRHAATTRVHGNRPVRPHPHRAASTSAATRSGPA